MIDEGAHVRRHIMKFRPLQDRILIKRVDGEEKTAGGIIIPNSAQEKPQEGLVVAIGNGKRLDDGTLIEVDLKKGQEIFFGKNWKGSECALFSQISLHEKVAGFILTNTNHFTDVNEKNIKLFNQLGQFVSSGLENLDSLEKHIIGEDNMLENTLV